MLAEYTLASGRAQLPQADSAYAGDISIARAARQHFTPRMTKLSSSGCLLAYYEGDSVDILLLFLFSRKFHTSPVLSCGNVRVLR